MRGRGPKRDRATVTIERVVAGGSGLARIDGEVVLIPHVIAGEEVAIELDRSRRPARGSLLKVLKSSAERVDPPCPVFAACGGCDLLHVSRAEQRRVRLELLRSALPESIRDREITWIDASPDRGRTRARWHGKSVGGRVLVGQRAHGAHTIVDMPGCHALDPRLEKALTEVRAMLAGCIGDGEIQAALGSNGLPVVTIRWRGALAASAFGIAERRVRDGTLAGVELWSEGASKPATIGDPRIVVPVDDGPPLVSPPGAFSQASEVGDRVLVRRVVEHARANDRRVLELFAGSGNFTVALAAVAAHVTTVELSSSAVDAARHNVAARGLSAKAKVIEGDADQPVFPAKIQVVVLDPPRSGARGACAVIADERPDRVVYVSCDPATLGRDLVTLLAVGYAVEAIDAVDLFPGTSHVEAVVALSLASPP